MSVDKAFGKYRLKKSNSFIAFNPNREDFEAGFTAGQKTLSPEVREKLEKVKDFFIFKDEENPPTCLECNIRKKHGHDKIIHADWCPIILIEELLEAGE